jgi:hypothetical protein
VLEGRFGASKVFEGAVLCPLSVGVLIPDLPFQFLSDFSSDAQAIEVFHEQNAFVREFGEECLVFLIGQALFGEAQNVDIEPR